MSFWDTTSQPGQNIRNTKQAKPWEQPETYIQESSPMELDEQALAEIQEEQYDVFEEEEDDMSSVLNSANKRLECGRLFELIIKNSIFGETDADPDAIRTVERLMGNFAKNQLELMLGMRQEQTPQVAIISSPFNDMEVEVLKLLASKMSKGATENHEPAPAPLVQSPPKRDGISTINGTVRPKTSTPLRRDVNPVVKQRMPKPNPKPNAPLAEKKIVDSFVEEVSALQKPIEQMTPEELVAYDKASSARSLKKYATMPNNLVPHPTNLEAFYSNHLNQIAAPGSAVANMMTLMNQRK
jgi:hypothetical protein